MRWSRDDKGRPPRGWGRGPRWSAPGDPVSSGPIPERRPCKRLCSAARWTRTPAPAPIVGRDKELVRPRAGARRARRGPRGVRDASRASSGSARRGCCASCARSRSSAATWCSPGARPSSSASCRTACSSTRSTRTPRRTSARAGIPTWRASSAACCRRCAAPTAAGAIADERYRAHRAVRRLLELLAEERPVVLELDDLHWSDGASLELIGGARAAPAGGARAARARLPVRAGGGAADRRARRAAGEPARARAAEPRRGGAAARTAPAPSSVAAIYDHAGGNPFFLEQLGARPAARSCRARSGTRAPRRPSVPPAVAAAIAEEIASLPAHLARVPRGGAVAGEPFEPDLAAAIAEQPDADGLAALDDLLARDLVRPTAVPRRFGFRHPLRAPRRLRVGARRLAARRARARRRGAGGARRCQRPSGRTTSSSRRAAATRPRSRSCSRPAAPPLGRAPAAAAGWFEAALRLLPSADAERQVDVRVALASAQRSAGELVACRATLLEATRAASGRGRDAARGADGAVRRGRALAGAPRGRAPAARARVGGAARRLDAGGRDAPDRAGGRRALRERLRADVPDGLRRRSTPPARWATAG